MRLALAIATLAVLFACGTTLAEPEDVAAPATDAGDASSDATDTEAGTDAGTDGDAEASVDAPCSPDLPFGSATPLSDLDELGEIRSVRVHRDGGALAFVSMSSVDAPSLDIRQGPFPKPPSLTYSSVVTAPEAESSPAVIGEGLKLYFDREVDGGVRIFSGARSDVEQNLSGIVVEALPMPGVATEAFQPWSVAGSEILYYAVSPATAGSSDIRRAARPGVGSSAWVDEPISALTGILDDSHPVVSDDELVMYFARKEGPTRKIWLARRATRSEGWSTPSPLDGDVSSTGNDEPSWLSPDQCTLLFTSDRSGTSRAYAVVRQKT